MDCDYNPETAAAAAAVRRAPEELVTGRGRKKRRGRLAELLRRKKPRFEPGGHQPLAEYVDQYYRLDEQANPHPFKYRQVAANDFGLDTEEVGHTGAGQGGGVRLGDGGGSRPLWGRGGDVLRGWRRGGGGGCDTVLSNGCGWLVVACLS